VDIVGTSLAPSARGDARVTRENGRSHVKLRIHGLAHPQAIGPSYTTYLLWAVAPDGQASRMGELPVRIDSTFTGTTPLQSFGLMATAEPYATITVPGTAVVAENVDSGASPGTGATVPVKVLTPAEPLAPSHMGQPDYDTPLPLLGARHAVAAAEHAGAATFAAPAWQDVQNRLAALEQSWATLKPDRTKFLRQFGGPARDLMESAESARQASVAGALQARRQADEAAARAMDAVRGVAVQAAVTAREAFARARQEADAARQRAEQAQTEAEREKTRAALARAEAAVVRAEAERIRLDAEAARAAEANARATTDRLRADADRARTDAQRAEADARVARAQARDAQHATEALRRELMDALSEVIETRRDERGAVCSLSDVLFDTDTATLTPGGREKLQRMATVLLGHHQHYTVQIEGHTDASGADDYNLKLSQQRADAVRQSLEEAGVDSERIVATRGVGSASPVASNDTPEGRQLNRRVEIVIGDGATLHANDTARP
jgi:outer membrane protein OmpA-like peptidoglycan-associated protein